MTIVVLLFAIMLLCFAGVLAVGAPYLPTLTPQVRAALELAALEPGDTLLELGCGDGKILVAAAQKGISVVGYELNPLLVIVCKIRTLRYRKFVTIIWGDFWKKQWPPAAAIFVFLLPRYMEKLDKKVIQYKHKPVKLISFAFAIPSKKPDRRRNGLFVYHYR